MAMEFPRWSKSQKKAGVRHFSNFSASDEAFGGKSTILKKRITNHDFGECCILEDWEELIRKGISFYVFDFERLEAAIAVQKLFKFQQRSMLRWKQVFSEPGFGLEVPREVGP